MNAQFYEFIIKCKLQSNKFRYHQTRVSFHKKKTPAEFYESIIGLSSFVVAKKVLIQKYKKRQICRSDEILMTQGYNTFLFCKSILMSELIFIET